MTITDLIERALRDDVSFETLSRFDAALASKLRERLNVSARLIDTRKVLIALIGNFSSGKSTLINSLIGIDILPTGNVPVTAQVYNLGAHPTYGYGYHPPRTAHPKLKKIAKHKLSQSVHKLHEYSKRAQEVRNDWLYVGINDWSLSPRLSILDTPGYNSENPLHAECTLQALPYADLAVFVTEARGLSRSDLDFIQDYIAPQVSRIAVILNKVDIVGERSEINELLTVTRAKLSNIGFQHVDVLPCSAKGVNDPYLGISGWDEVTTWLEALARDSLEDLICESVATEIAVSFGPNCTAVEEKRSLLTESLAQLQHRLERLDHFSIRQAKQRLITQLTQSTEIAKSKVESEVTSALNQQRAELLKWLAYGNVRDEGVVKAKFQELQAALQSALKHSITQIKNQSSHERRGALKEINALIERDWRDLVKTQQALYHDGAPSHHIGSTLGEVPVINLPDIDAEILGAAGGLGAGAMIGTMILPGIGTIVGGLLGGLFGFLMGDATEKAREQIREAWFGYERSFMSESSRVISEVYQDEIRLHSHNLNQLEESYIQQLKSYRGQLNQERQIIDQQFAEVREVKSILDRWLREITGRDVDYVFAHYRDAKQMSFAEHHQSSLASKSLWAMLILLLLISAPLIYFLSR